MALTSVYESDVEAFLKTILGHTRVYDTEVPDDVVTPRYPHVILYWGEPIRTGTDHHITGVKNDTLRGFLTVRIISETADSVRVVKDRIKPALTGYRPVDCGELIPEGGLAYSRATAATKPTLYIRELYFSFVTNLSYNE